MFVMLRKVEEQVYKKRVCLVLVFNDQVLTLLYLEGGDGFHQ